MNQLKDLKYIIVLLVVVAVLVVANIAGKNRFTENAKSLIETLNSTPVFIPGTDIKDADFFVVFVGNPVSQTVPSVSLQIPFEKLAEKATLQQIKSSGKKIVLASEIPGQAAKAWVILNQLGVKNLFILSDENPGILRYNFVPETTNTKKTLK